MTNDYILNHGLQELAFLCRNDWLKNMDGLHHRKDKLMDYIIEG